MWLKCASLACSTFGCTIIYNVFKIVRHRSWRRPEGAQKKNESKSTHDAVFSGRNDKGSASALARMFGNPPLWGDLSPNTLLPRSLLGLHTMGLMNPEELASLAYEARIAAKEYARSRCVWTGRLITKAFDQYRSLRSSVVSVHVVG